MSDFFFFFDASTSPQTIFERPGQETRCTSLTRLVPNTGSPLALSVIFKHTSVICPCLWLWYSALVSKKGPCPWLSICLIDPAPLVLPYFGSLHDMPCLCLLLRPVIVINPLLPSARLSTMSVVLLEYFLKTPQGGLTLPFTVHLPLTS